MGRRSFFVSTSETITQSIFSMAINTCIPEFLIKNTNVIDFVFELILLIKGDCEHVKNNFVIES